MAHLSQRVIEEEEEENDDDDHDDGNEVRLAGKCKGNSSEKREEGQRKRPTRIGTPFT